MQVKHVSESGSRVCPSGEMGDGPLEGRGPYSGTRMEWDRSRLTRPLERMKTPNGHAKILSTCELTVMLPYLNPPFSVQH